MWDLSDGPFLKLPSLFVNSGLRQGLDSHGLPFNSTGANDSAACIRTIYIGWLSKLWSLFGSLI